MSDFHWSLNHNFQRVVKLISTTEPNNRLQTSRRTNKSLIHWRGKLPSVPFIAFLKINHENCDRQMICVPFSFVSALLFDASASCTYKKSFKSTTNCDQFINPCITKLRLTTRCQQVFLNRLTLKSLVINWHWKVLNFQNPYL